jgi:hypothetical protein
MTHTTIETVECSHCGIETQLFARIHHNNENWYIDLCSQCFEIAMSLIAITMGAVVSAK